MFEEYKPEIARMEKIVQSLNEFHSQTQALDANHQAQVENLNTVIQALFEAPDTFTGSAANALKELIGNYLHAEHSFTGYPGDTSSRLAAATGYCEKSAETIESELQKLYSAADDYTYKLDVLSSESFAQRELTYVANNLLGGPYAGVSELDVEAHMRGECPLPPETQRFVEEMETEVWQWNWKMDSVAAEPLPVLPPYPTDLSKFNADPGSVLYPTNGGESLNDLTIKLIAGQLRAEGYTVDDAEVEALWNAGYKNPDDIKAILRMGSHAVYQYALSHPISTAQIKDLAGAVKLAQRTIDDAQRGRVRRAKDYNKSDKYSGTNYHGRLSAALEQEILSHPDYVYVSTGKERKFVFLKDGNVVITLGVGTYRGQIITSYGPGGRRSESGASIYGGSVDDPGVPITDEMVRNGKIPKAKSNPTDTDTYEPPAIPIIDNAGS